MVRLLLPSAMMIVLLVATTTSQTLSNSLVNCTLTNGSSISFDPNAEYHHEHNCYKIKCERGQFVTYQSGCLADDFCYRRGNVYYIEDCSHVVCARVSPDTYGHLLMAHHCQDMHGFCHLPGEPFHMLIHGDIYHNCTCDPTRSIFDSYACSDDIL